MSIADARAVTDYDHGYGDGYGYDLVSYVDRQRNVQAVSGSPASRITGADMGADVGAVPGTAQV